MATPLRAPFPWFGGKRRVADIVWRAFGPDVNNYVEPFAGSLAVLLGRPGGPGKIETVNDADRMIANFWRAVTYHHRGRRSPGTQRGAMRPRTTPTVSESAFGSVRFA